MIFETVKSEKLAQFSYVLGDESAGECIVIDPRRDVDAYIDLAHRNQVQIKAIVETHIHADFVSGSRELAAQTGAPIYGSARGEYGFQILPLEEGDVLEAGSHHLEVLHTPGHTPEHISLLVSSGSGSPWGLFTGDTLFAGEVGRPDLLGESVEKELAERLHHSLFEKILPLGDEIIVYPGHGEGSPCGAQIGERPTTTLGYERRHNPLLRNSDKDAFVSSVFDSLTPAPRYYSRMKEINAAGPPLLNGLPEIEPLSAEEFRDRMDDPDTVMVDTRTMAAFGGAHIPGALNIGEDESFPIWLGWMLDPRDRLLLVFPDEDSYKRVRRYLVRVGFDRAAGYLQDGINGWIDVGLPFERLTQMSVRELQASLESGENLQILDVRTESAYNQGHVPGAIQLYAPYVIEKLDQLDPDRPTAVYCTIGYRSSIVASQLQQQGFSDVRVVLGSMKAWRSAGFELA